MKASFNRHAARELIDSGQYLQAEANLGYAFFDEYEEWEKQIVKHPHSCPEILPGIRIGFLKRFKHHVIYTVRKNT